MREGKLTVALLSGGKSAEREVSLKGGREVFEALDKERYRIIRFDPRDDLPRLAREASEIDAALIVLHGRLGEDGTIQGFLESLGVPHQGSGVLGSALAMNKIVSKQIYLQAGLPVAPFVVADRRSPAAPESIVERLGLPLVVKPEHEGSSIGLSIVRDAERLAEAVEDGWRYDRRCLVEKFIEGREITCAILGNDTLEALPLVEIIPGDAYEFFDYEAKYTPGASREICPADLPEELAEKARRYALGAHQALYCRGCSRTDMIVAAEEIYLLETNTIPGMTATSLLPQAAAAAGISFSALLDRLISLAIENGKG